MDGDDFLLTPVPLQPGATRAIRLTDMNKAILREKHKAWLTQMVKEITNRKNDAKVTIQITGFASTKGASKSNMDLSEERALAVRDWISTISEWAARQCKIDYSGEAENWKFGRRNTSSENQDDFLWRSVEVQVIGSITPHKEKPNRVPDRFPGASEDWELRKVGAFSLPLKAGGVVKVAKFSIGFLLFRRAHRPTDIHLFVALQMGMQLSLAELVGLLKDVKVDAEKDGTFFLTKQQVELLEDIIKAAVKGSFDGLAKAVGGNWEKLRVVTPFRFADLHGATMQSFSALDDARTLTNVHKNMLQFNPKTGMTDRWKDSILFAIEKSDQNPSLDGKIGEMIGGPLLDVASFSKT